MKMLVTGATGFIGSHLCDYLVDEGHEIVGVDNLSLGKISNIQHLLKNSKFIFKETDILNQENMKKIFKEHKFEMVFHLAANSDIAISRENPTTDLNNTFLTTFNILNYMRENNVKKIFFSSTSAIYGEVSDLLHENFGPLIPVSHYGAAKLASESFISSFVANYNMQAWITRFPNVVGERATHGVIFDFINKLNNNPQTLEVLGDGEQFKPYLYVKDLIEAILFVCRNSNDNINIFNLGVSSRTKVKDIAKMVIEEMGLVANINYTGGNRGWIGDVPAFSYDLSKIYKLGLQAKLSSNEAVRKAIKFILSNK